MEPDQEKLAEITAPMRWNFSTVVDLTHIEALPLAAKYRETKKAADTFVSTGRNVFLHYAALILDERRKRLLGSGLRKKKYPKTAAQLWQTICMEEQFYWNEASRELRQSIKQGSLSPKGCLIHGGRLSDQKTYLWHAELAVAAYLELPIPEEDAEPEATMIVDGPDQKRDMLEKATTLIGTCETTLVTKTANIPTCDVQHTELVDTLPDRFEYEPRMLYSHFSHYDYDAVRAAEGKHQTAMLHQLADLLDKTGKVLFYYCVVPRLCKQSYPPTAGETVTGQASDVWKYMLGAEKEKWCNASVSVKKKLGDGDLGGLEVLELGSLDPEVLRLHELAAAALKSHEQRKKTV